MDMLNSILFISSIHKLKTLLVARLPDFHIPGSHCATLNHDVAHSIQSHTRTTLAVVFFTAVTGQNVVILQYSKDKSIDFWVEMFSLSLCLITFSSPVRMASKGHRITNSI